LVRAIVYHAADAEEVTCDVYIQAWQTAEKFNPARGAVLTWLLAIARARALDCLRRRRGKLRVFEDCGSESQTEHQLAEHDTPERALSLFQSGSVVHSALDQLPVERRRLICLAFFEGLSHSEIAGLTGLPMGTVKSHLRRALQTLRSLLYDAELE
jgi:RNA polymerase sigma-70 factor (ECF subfamily)